MFSIFFGAIMKAVIERTKDHLSGGTEEKEWSTADYQVKLQKIVDVFMEVTDAYGQEVPVKEQTSCWLGSWI